MKIRKRDSKYMKYNHTLHPNDIVKRIIDKRSELLDRFAEVYLGHIYEKTGKMPQIKDIELVEEREGTSIRWYFREKCIRK